MRRTSIPQKKSGCSISFLLILGLSACAVGILIIFLIPLEPTLPPETPEKLVMRRSSENACAALAGLHQKIQIPHGEMDPNLTKKIWRLGLQGNQEKELLAYISTNREILSKARKALSKESRHIRHLRGFTS